jgi:hypothetical protein
MERALAWAQVCATSAWHRHAGFYASPRLEAALFRLSEEVTLSEPSFRWSLPRGSRRHWLHILTAASDRGGHTPLAETFIRRQSVEGDTHSLLLVDQGHHPIPRPLEAAVQASNGGVVTLPPSMTLLERAATVRAVAIRWADVVVLHTHPNDPTGCVAFSQAGGPPVLVYNHADHVFWLGSGIADLVLDLRVAGQELTRTRRPGAETRILPIPLRSRPPSGLRPVDAKHALGIPASTRLLLSVANSSKFTPCGDRDFPFILARALAPLDNVLLMVIGPSAHEPRWSAAREWSQGKVIALGVKRDLEPYFAAADLFVESFPISSFTACLDAVLRGIPLLRAPAPPVPFLSLDFYDGMNDTPSTVQEYVSTLHTWLRDDADLASRGDTQRAAVARRHVGAAWEERRVEVIRAIPLRHKSSSAREEDGSSLSQSYDEVWARMQADHGTSVLRPTVRHLRNSLTKSDILQGLRIAYRYGEATGNAAVFSELLLDASVLALPARALRAASALRNFVSR